jgi:AefR-like transcriptional repressor, C-terminal domain
MLNIDAEPMEPLPTSEALERILVAYGTLTLSDETIAMNRLIIRECDQFPEIAAAFYEAAIQRTTDAMAGWLRRQCERGLIKLEDLDPVFFVHHCHSSAGSERRLQLDCRIHKSWRGCCAA